MSRPPRFFISPEQVQDDRITVADEDVRHITSVLRMRAGDELLLCDGRGTEYRVRITGAGKNEVRTEILDRMRRERTGPRIVLGQGIARSDKMDWIVQKATELGAASIVPLITERTIVKVRDGEKRVSRWQKICREAAMQSDRPDIPEVRGILSFRDFLLSLRTIEVPNPHHPPLARGDDERGGSLPAPEQRTLLLLPWEEGTEPIKNVLRAHPAANSIIALIGPEGGFSQAEADLARTTGFHAVSLGPNILRTETAAVAALSMVLYERS